MLKVTLISLVAASSINAGIKEDLSMPGERWLAKATGYVCDSKNAGQVARPESLEQFDVVFETLTTDYSLDNGLIKASFVEEGYTCRYSAILFADNAASTVELVESRAYAIDGDIPCEGGKQLIDELLTFNDYLYWGRPHHLTIMVPEQSAELLCGEGATHVGIDFTLVGRI